MTIVPLRITTHPEWMLKELRYDVEDIAVMEFQNKIAITRCIRRIRELSGPIVTNEQCFLNSDSLPCFL